MERKEISSLYRQPEVSPLYPVETSTNSPPTTYPSSSTKVVRSFRTSVSQKLTHLSSNGVNKNKSSSKRPPNTKCPLQRLHRITSVSINLKKPWRKNFKSKERMTDGIIEYMNKHPEKESFLKNSKKSENYVRFSSEIPNGHSDISSTHVTRRIDIHHTQGAKLCQTVQSQTHPSITRHLRCFPKILASPESCTNLLTRWTISLCGLTIILCLWTFLNALVLNVAEEPQGKCQRDNFKRRENDLMVELATDLRKVIPQESVWLQTIKKYVNKHQEILVQFNMSTGSQTTWSLSDCLLFFYTFLTTFGLRQLPIPTTTPGKLCVAIFTVVAFPLHIVIIMNTGSIIASKITRNISSSSEVVSNGKGAQAESYKMKKTDLEEQFLKVLPFAAFGIYYLCGLVTLGASRSLPFPEILLFPLDLTPGPFSKEMLEVLFGIYHELGFLLTLTILALFKKLLGDNVCNHLSKLGVFVFE
nr:PREDICTED: uncharacterized protein LOC109034419 [Bemisia tabaci]